MSLLIAHRFACKEPSCLAVFTLVKEPPTKRNIIVFDDFVTTGATMISMRELLLPLGYNLVFFTGINNKIQKIALEMQ